MYSQKERMRKGFIRAFFGQGGIAVLAVAQIPWNEVIRLIPTVVIAARSLWTKSDSPDQVCPLDPETEMTNRMAACMERLHALEASDSKQAYVIRQLAEQLEGITAGLTQLSRRSSVGVWLGATALVVACAAASIALLIVLGRDD
jgi:hypothetical protein